MTLPRVLRSQWLYIMFAGLIVLLYMRAAPVRLSEPMGEKAAVGRPRAGAPLEWWPAELTEQRLEEIRRRDPGVIATLWALTLTGAGMALAGLALTAHGVWTGRIRALWSCRARRLPPWSFGEIGRLLVLVLMLSSVLPFVHRAFRPFYAAGEPDPHLWITVSMLFLDLCVILLVLSFAIGKRASLTATLGLSSRQRLMAASVGLQSYLMMFPWLVALLFLIVQLVHRLGWTPPIEPIQELIFDERRPQVLALTALLVCVVAPVAEELLFRGVLYPAFRRKMSRLAAMLASGAAFSLVHTNVVGFLPILALGCLLAYLYERTGSLVGPLAVHIVHNSFLLGLALAFRRLLVAE